MSYEWIESSPSSPLRPDLPPPEFRTFFPQTGERKRTPTDRHGMVDIAGFIALMQTMVVPRYNWISPDTSFETRGVNHHVQTLRRWYDDGNNLKAFYNANMRQVSIPPTMHGLAHETLIPADPPRKVVQEAFISVSQPIEQMWQILVGSEMAATKAYRRGASDREGIFYGHLDGHLNEFQDLVDVATHGSKEFQVIDFSRISINSIQDMIALRKQLRPFATPQTPVPILRQNGQKAA